ncbi:MAG: hypothetical protein RR846_05315 [Oscillospiraceae bacterium]
MTNREWLCRGYKLAIEIRELETAYNTALSEVDYISPSFGNDAQMGQNNAAEGKNVKAIGLNAELLELIASKRKIIADITKAIDGIGDGRVRTILYARYVNCKTIECIAAENNLDYRWVQRLIRRGENQIKIF